MSRLASLRGWLSSPAVLFCATVTMSYSYFPPTAGWNENTRFDLTRAIVEQGSLFIDAYHENTGDKSRCRGEHFCTDKAPGASLVGLVPYALFRQYLRLRRAPPPETTTTYASAERARQGSLSPADRVQANGSFLLSLYVVGLFASALPGALAGLLLVWLGRTVGADRKVAFLVGAIYSLGTIAFPFSTALFGHQLATFLLLFGYVLVESTRLEEPGPRTAGKVLAAGLLAGSSVVAEYTTAVPLALLGLYLMITTRCRRGRTTLLFGAGAAVPLGGLGLYLWAAFGSFFTVGYSKLANPEFARGQNRGLFGITRPRLGALAGTLFGRFRGLLYVSPVLALSLWGAIRLWVNRSGRPVLLFSAAMIAYFLLLNSSYYLWWGGASAGPRHVLPMLPFLCLPLVQVFAEGQPWRVAGWALATVSIFNTVAVTVAGVKAPERGDLLLDHAWPAMLGLSNHPAQMTLGRRLGLPPAADLAVLLLFWTLAALVILQRLKEQTAARGAAGTP